MLLLRSGSQNKRTCSFRLKLLQFPHAQDQVGLWRHHSLDTFAAQPTPSGIFYVQMLSAKPACSCPRREQLALTAGLTAESRERSGSIHNSPDVCHPKYPCRSGRQSGCSCGLLHFSPCNRILTKHCFFAAARLMSPWGKTLLNTRSKLWDCLTIEQLSVSGSFVGPWFYQDHAGKDLKGRQ